MINKIIDETGVKIDIEEDGKYLFIKSKHFHLYSDEKMLIDI